MDAANSVCSKDTICLLWRTGFHSVAFLARRVRSMMFSNRGTLEEECKVSNKASRFVLIEVALHLLEEQVVGMECYTKN